MAKIKKAQGGIKVVPQNLNERQMKRVDRISENNPERAKRVATRISNRRNARGAENPRMTNMRPPDSMPSPDMLPTYGVGANVTAKKGKTISKAKNGKSFDLNKDGKTTFKDVLIGRGVLPKTAKSGTKMKMGGTIKKAQTGTVQSANQQIQSNVNKIAMKNAGDSIKKSMAGNAKNGKSMKKCRYGCK